MVRVVNPLREEGGALGLVEGGLLTLGVMGWRREDGKISGWERDQGDFGDDGDGAIEEGKEEDGEKGNEVE
jgi:hypothetical protein